jgi:arsenate reductase-like glutaredoxin family protein
MNTQLVPGRRGLIYVRADASDPKAMLEQLSAAWEAFKTERDEEIKALKKGQEDVVKTEKVDRINAAKSAISRRRLTT